MFRFDQAHFIPAPHFAVVTIVSAPMVEPVSTPDVREEAISALWDLLANEYTHVAYDPTHGIVGATDDEVIPDAAFTDFVPIRNGNGLSQDAIEFAVEILMA